MPIKKAFTLIEVLIVVAILALLVLGSLTSFTQQRLKAEDARVKSYLARLKIAFEEYYNDHNCFPPTTWFDDASDCGSASLSPYLSMIQCDKKTGLPYIYETDGTSCHQWFKLYATFNRPDMDEQALAQRSATGSTKGNYGVSSTNVNVTVYSTSPLSSPSPSPSTPSSSHEYYWCSAPDNCTNYYPNEQSCTPSYTDDPNCGGSNDSKCPTAGVCTAN